MKTRRGTRSSPRQEGDPDPAPAQEGGLEDEAPMSPAEPTEARKGRRAAPKEASPKAPPAKRPKVEETLAQAESRQTRSGGTRSEAAPPPPKAKRAVRGASREEPISVEALTGDSAESTEAPLGTRAAKRKSSALNPAAVPAPRPTQPPTLPSAQVQIAVERRGGAEAPCLEAEGGVSDEEVETDVVGVTEDVKTPDISQRKYHVGSGQKGGLRPLIYEEPSNNPRGSRLIVEAPAIAAERPFVETPLPGTADEVESYPCRFCPERVFLTSFGLERHTKMAHPEAVEEVLGEIGRIQEEWKRREAEREKQKERLALAKIRQEALAAAAAREAMQSIAAAAHPEMEEDDRAVYLPQHTLRGGGRGGPSGVGGYGTERIVSGSGNFESCRICGLLINAEHPTAMENHMRAHKKNDQLRNQLLQTVGAEFVARVTCHECQLVFTDERKLIAHAEAMHVRRRKYVCKWCGHVCLTMTDLNNHKADVHGMPVSRSRDPDTRRNRQIASLTKGRGMPPPLGVQSAASRRAAAVAEAQRGGGSSPRVLTSVEELPCRTTCDMCGLVMVKPSLLIRHMMRVHNRTNFTATVETKGMPSFRISVEQGKLSWTCCGEDYTDRAQFVYHRRMNHTPKLNPAGGVYGAARSWQVDRNQGGVVAAAASSSGGEAAIAGMSQEAIAAAAANGQTVTGEDGQQYVLMLVDAEGEGGDEGGADGGETSAASAPPPEGSGNVTVRGQNGEQIVLTPDQLQELGITAAEAENVILMVEDGTGEESEPAAPATSAADDSDTTTIIVPEDPESILSQVGTEGVVFVDEHGKPIENTEGLTIRVNAAGEMELVEAEAAPLPTSGESKPGIILPNPPAQSSNVDADNFEEYLNTDGASGSQQ